MSSFFSTNPEGLNCSKEAGLSFKIGSSSRTGGCGCTGGGGGGAGFRFGTGGGVRGAMYGLCSFSDLLLFLLKKFHHPFDCRDCLDWFSGNKMGNGSWFGRRGRAGGATATLAGRSGTGWGTGRGLGGDALIWSLGTLFWVWFLFHLKNLVWWQFCNFVVVSLPLTN